MIRLIHRHIINQRPGISINPLLTSPHSSATHQVGSPGLRPFIMAPARKSGRAPSTSTPMTTRRRGVRVPVRESQQEEPQVPRRPPPSARRGARQARTRLTPYTQPSPNEVLTGASTSSQGTQGVAAAETTENASVLQGQISELYEQVTMLTSLLQTQGTQPPTTGPASRPTTNAAPPSAPSNPAPAAASPENDPSPFIDAIRMLSDSGTLTPNTNQKFMSYGFSKLDSSVSTEMRNIIQSNKFINLEVLMPGRVGAVDFLFNQTLPHKVSVHSSKLTKFTSFEDWMEAYLIFAAVYIQKFPNEAQGILKHLSTVKRLHRQGFKWYEYDFEFRHFVASSSLTFEVYLPEVLERAKERQPFLSGQQHPRKYSSGTSAAQRPIPNRLCYAFARGTCQRRPCPFKHECHLCGKPHPPSTCSLRQQFKSFQRPVKPEAQPSKGPNSS